MMMRVRRLFIAFTTLKIGILKRMYLDNKMVAVQPRAFGSSRVRLPGLTNILSLRVVIIFLRPFFLYR